MRDITLSNKSILLYRILFASLSWFTIIVNIFISTISSGLPLIWLLSFRYYTMQTNLMVSIWFTLAIIRYNKKDSLEKIMGPLKGAFTLYITTTFVFFAILLQIFYQPTGWSAFSNIILHYITPIAFIGDWIFTEKTMRYKWKYLLYWMVYPLAYLIFALIHGIFTGDYLYPFLNINALGPLVYILSLCFLIGVGTVLGSVYIAFNRKRIKE
ncbi:MAG: Pr6Pr family membrane protein [Candidatus Odinarchaeota archaeon]